MATVLKIKRVSNPRRRMRRAGASVSRKRIKRARRTRKVAARRKRRNPALVATLGAINPRRRKNVKIRRRRKAVSHRRRRATNPRRRRTRRNPTRIVVVAPRKHNRRRRSAHRRNPVRRHVRRYRRNPGPSLFGSSITSKSGLQLIAGGVVGVAATKFIPTILPTSMLGSVATSGIGRVLVSGVAAYIAGFAAGKLSPRFGEGVMFGGMMQTASVALNAFMPGFNIAGIPLGLNGGRGMGDLLPGSFVVPQNPIRAAIAPPAPPAQQRITVNGLARAYGTAF
jgi:hypothetical protein